MSDEIVTSNEDTLRNDLLRMVACCCGSVHRFCENYGCSTLRGIIDRLDDERLAARRALAKELLAADDDLAGPTPKPLRLRTLRSKLREIAEEA